jgi:hypothetical protein
MGTQANRQRRKRTSLLELPDEETPSGVEEAATTAPPAGADALRERDERGERGEIGVRRGETGGRRGEDGTKLCELVCAPPEAGMVRSSAVM